MKITKSLLAVFAIGFAGILSGCGDNSSMSAAEVVRAGTAGPTNSGYYFNLTVSPGVINVDGSSTITVRVWNNLGPVENVDVGVSGDVTNPAIVQTDVNGYVIGSYTVNGGAATTSYLTATVENLALTVGVQVTANPF